MSSIDILINLYILLIIFIRFAVVSNYLITYKFIFIYLKAINLLNWIYIIEALNLRLLLKSYMIAINIYN